MFSVSKSRCTLLWKFWTSKQTNDDETFGQAIILQLDFKHCTRHNVQVKKPSMAPRKYTTSAREQIWNLLLDRMWVGVVNFEGFLEYKNKVLSALSNIGIMSADYYFVFVRISASKILMKSPSWMQKVID